MTPHQMKLLLEVLVAQADTLELMRRQFAEAIDRIVVALSSVN